MKVCEFIDVVEKYKDAHQHWEQLAIKSKSDTPPSKTEWRFAYMNLLSHEGTLDEWLPLFKRGIDCVHCRYACKCSAGVCRNFEPKEDESTN